MRKLLTILFLLLICLIAQSQTTYHVSSDSTLSTIAQVNAGSYSAGDSILFNKGDTWRESLIMPSGGSVGSPIVVSSYGTGVRPQILGSDVSTFANVTGNIWATAAVFTVDPTGSAEIWFVEPDDSIKWGVQTAFADLDTEYEWHWSNDSIYVVAATDPDTRYTTVEVPQRWGAVICNNQEYITFDGLEVAFPLLRGVNTNTQADGFPDADLHGLTVNNLDVHHSGEKDGGGYGLAVNYSDMNITNCDIYENGRRNLSLHVYGANFTTRNILIEYNHFRDGYHSTGGNGVISSGPGTLNNHLRYIRVINNIFEQNPNSTTVLPESSVSTLCGFGNDNTVDGGIIDSLYIYNNLFKGTDSYAIRLYGVKSAWILNNTFAGFNLVRSGNQMHIQVGRSDDGLEECENITIKNNIFYSDVVDATNPATRCISITATQSASSVDADYNLYYCEDALTEIVVISGDRDYVMSEIGDLRTDYSWEVNSPTPADPLFTSNLDDLTLQTGSPAIGAGLYPPLSATDYAGNSMNNPVDIGAYAFVYPVLYQYYIGSDGLPMFGSDGKIMIKN